MSALFLLLQLCFVANCNVLGHKLPLNGDYLASESLMPVNTSKLYKIREERHVEGSGFSAIKPILGQNGLLMQRMEALPGNGEVNLGSHEQADEALPSEEQGHSIGNKEELGETKAETDDKSSKEELGHPNDDIELLHDLDEGSGDIETPNLEFLKTAAILSNVGDGLVKEEEVSVDDKNDIAADVTDDNNDRDHSPDLGKSLSNETEDDIPDDEGSGAIPLAVIPVIPELIESIDGSNVEDDRNSDRSSDVESNQGAHQADDESEEEPVKSNNESTIIGSVDAVLPVTDEKEGNSTHLKGDMSEGSEEDVESIITQSRGVVVNADASIESFEGQTGIETPNEDGKDGNESAVETDLHDDSLKLSKLTLSNDTNSEDVTTFIDEDEEKDDEVKLPAGNESSLEFEIEGISTTEPGPNEEIVTFTVTTEKGEEVLIHLESRTEEPTNEATTTKEEEEFSVDNISTSEPVPSEEPTTTEELTTTEIEVLEVPVAPGSPSEIPEETTLVPSTEVVEIFTDSTTPEGFHQAEMSLKENVKSRDDNILNSGSSDERSFGAYIIIGLIGISFLVLIVFLVLRKRSRGQKVRLDNNQDRDPEKALLSNGKFKEDSDENNVKNNEITPLVIKQNSQINKFEKTPNFSSPKNLNTTANEKNVEKDNVLKSTQAIIEDDEDAKKVLEEEKKTEEGDVTDDEKKTLMGENLPTEKVVVRTHLDQDSIPKKPVLVTRNGNGYHSVSQAPA